MVERTMKTDRIYEGKIVSLKVETVELPNQKYSKREIVEHADAVAIVAITDEDEVILVKQYRKAIDKEIIELPAGKIEINENPRDCAIRELGEETGYTSNDIEHLVEFYTSPGFCTEKMYVFLAKNLVKSDFAPDEDEFVECIKVKFDKAIEMISTGDIADAKTISGLYAYKSLRGTI